MVDAIVGKWRSDVSKTTGFDEFRAAIGNPEKYPSQPEEVTLEITRNGNEWTIKSERGDKVIHTTTLKEGEKSVTKGPEGMELELDGSVEGDRWVVIINARGSAIRSVTYVEGDELVQEQTVNGATLTSRFTRI